MLEVYGVFAVYHLGFFLNNFSRVINLLLTKLAWDHPGRILVLGLFCMDRMQRGPYKKDQGPIFSQYGPRAWLIRYMYNHAAICGITIIAELRQLKGPPSGAHTYIGN